MRVKIRVKLVLLLTVVALVPLMMGLVAVAMQGRRMRIEHVGHERVAVASAQAGALQNSLQANIQKVLLALQDDPDVIDILVDMFPARTVEEMEQLDAIWAREPFPWDHPAVTDVLNNRVSEHLHSIMTNSPEVAELLVTDRFGCLVAASGRTSDFHQADEAWWQGAYAEGKGSIYVPHVDYDQSADVWSVALCIPLSKDGEIIGVAKAVLDLPEWIEITNSPVGTASVEGTLINELGEIIYPHAEADGEEQRPGWAVAISQESVAGARPIEDGMIRAYAPLALPDEIAGLRVRAAKWTLVLQQPSAELLAEADRLMWMVIGGGAGVVLLVFVGGLVVIDRSIGRRIRRFQLVSSQVGRGDYSHHVAARGSRPLVGTDEIDDLAWTFNKMIDDVGHSQEELRNREAILSATGRMAKVGGWELDAETLAIRWTDEVFRIFELPMGEVPPLEEILSYFDPEDQVTLDRAIKKALLQGKPYDLELRLTTAKGKQIWTEATCEPVREGDKTVKLLGTFQDIAERKRVEGELTRSNEMKSNFIKVAGHELRTPLSFIMAMPKLMQDVTDVDRLRYALATMEAKGRRLNDIVQSMFKLMGEQDYTEYMNLEDVELSDILGRVQADCLPFIQERDQTLMMDHGEGIPTLRIDADKIHDVIENLVGNAIKFTPKGKMIRIEASAPDKEHVNISVIDQGGGITGADLPNIFNPFYSTGDVLKHTSGSIGETKHGMGLGLAVVKHFVEMHHGSIAVTTSSEGTTFTVTLPIRPPQAEPGVQGEAI